MNIFHFELKTGSISEKYIFRPVSAQKISYNKIQNLREKNIDIQHDDINQH